MRSFQGFLLASLFAVTAHAQQHTHVLMISVDGMKPEYVTHADEHGLKLPNLRRIMAQGTYVDGVTGTLPTITHPSHTTLVTGVTPAEHGIFGNRYFDPLLNHPDEWYWYADDVKSPTLWQAAHTAGISTASVFWPVTVNAKGIDYLLPAYPVRTKEDVPLLAAITRPVGYLEHLEQTIGPLYITSPVTAWDERLTEATVVLLKDAHPGLLTLHLVALDSAEHANGPFSEQANAVMEATDTLIGKLVEAAGPNTIVVVVSDHGFAPVHTRVNLLLPFIDAGLVTLNAAHNKIVDWKAMLWSADASAYVMLKDPNDAATKTTVDALLQKLGQDPQNGIARILAHEDIVREGGDPGAAFMIAMKSGYVIGEALQGSAIVTGLHTGTHGYTPDIPEMRSSFFAAGPGIPHCEVPGADIRQVAPTVASYLHVAMPSAKQPAILCPVSK